MHSVHRKLSVDVKLNLTSDKPMARLLLEWLYRLETLDDGVDDIVLKIAEL